jgi:hypothetical protein
MRETQWGSSMRHAGIAIGLLALVAAPALAQSGPGKIVLISEQEAALPAASAPDMTFRAGISRGPRIVVVFPPASDGGHSPVHVEFRFEAHGGAKIDPSLVKITYLKNPAVDLTERVKPFLGAGGIDIPAAEVPPGNHPIRVEVKDNEGRSGSVSFMLRISQ